MMITLVYACSIGVLLMALVAWAYAVFGKREMARGILFGCWVAALALFVVNWLLAQAVPFGNMRQVLSFFPLVSVPAAVYMRRWRGADLTAHFAAVAAFSMLGALCMPLQATWRQMPALQSPWFVPHVTSYVIAYGFLAVSAFAALASLSKKHAEIRMRAADEVVSLAFPFLTFGLLSGALWADVAWARYWAWDIKEAWALITWCVYLIYFHVRANANFASWRRPLILLGFVAVLFTFFVVNLMPAVQSIHSYAR
ncbi:MAG: cytochrome c biogenesis protein CcsA [Akkermansia sp.]|nr:cytochrome c biogenesis protein CcsA [Akkermansia sp.]